MIRQKQAVATQHGSYLKAIAFTVALAAAIMICGRAHAEFLDFGGKFQTGGSNAPNTFGENDTLTLGTTVIDGGLLDLTVTTAAAGGGGEWVIFTVQTTSGGPIAGDLNADWAFGIDNVPLAMPAVMTQFYLDFGTNGVLVSPTNNIGANLPLETNPYTGSGTVFGEPVSIDLTTILSDDAFASTFASFLGANGFDPGALNEYQVGQLLEPVPVPEPGTLGLFGMALLALGGLGLRRKAA